MKILIDIIGGLSLTGAGYWVLTRPPNRSPDKRRCLGVNLEDLVLSLVIVVGTLLFLAAEYV